MTTMRLTGRLLHRWWTGMGALVLALALFELLNPYVAASLGGTEGLDAIIARLPPLLLALIRAQGGAFLAGGLAGYLTIGFTHPIFLLLTGIPIVAFVCLTLAGEMARGTIQLALARPISRGRVYAARVLGTLVLAVVLAAAGPLGMIVGIALARPVGHLAYAHFLPVGVTTLALLWAIGGVALLAAAAAASTGRAVGWTTAVLLVSYLIDYLAQLWHLAKPLDPLSLYHYFDPGAALVDGTLHPRDLLVLGLVGLVGATGGLWVFARRDLPT